MSFNIQTELELEDSVSVSQSFVVIFNSSVTFAASCKRRDENNDSVW